MQDESSAQGESESGSLHDDAVTDHPTLEESLQHCSILQPNGVLSRESWGEEEGRKISGQWRRRRRRRKRKRRKKIRRRREGEKREKIMVVPVSLHSYTLTEGQQLTGEVVQKGNNLLLSNSFSAGRHESPQHVVHPALDQTATGSKRGREGPKGKRPGRERKDERLRVRL